MSLDAIQIILRANQIMNVEQLELMRDAANLARLNALEEAAKVADRYHRIFETRRDLFDDGNITVTKGNSLVDPRKISNAIRAMKGDE